MGLVSRVFATPVNYKGSDGRWHAIESALTPRALGGYENTANNFSLTLPESLSTGVTLSNQGRSVSFSLEGAAASFPSVSGNTATYPSVLPSTNLSYVSEAAGVQELATLKNSEAPTQLRYALSTTGGLSPRQEANGAIALVSEQGAVWFTIPAPEAFAQGANADTGQALPSTITAAGSGWVLTVDTGESWLREELASKAVVVDPSIESSASQACTLWAGKPATSECSATSLQVGFETGVTFEHHALLRFPVSAIPAGALVLNAKLGLYVQSETKTTAKAVGVYRVTKPWTTGATWETYDGTHAWTTRGGDYANPLTNSDASVNSSVGGSTGWYYWYPDRMVQEWVNTTNAPAGEGYANEGLIVKDQTDSQTSNVLTIASPTASADKPYLEVTYEPRGFGVEPQYTQISASLTDKLTMSVNPASGDLRLANNDLNVAGTAGMNFASLREYNALDPEAHTYGRWSDSTHVAGYELSNGDVEVWDNGSVFPFEKQSNGTFITPAGIKAVLCTASNSPCPKSLPAGTKWRLTFDDPSGIYVDIGAGDEAAEIANRYGDALTASYGEEGVGWTDTRGRAFKYLEGSYDAHTHKFVTELKDTAGARHTSYTYGAESEAGGSQLRSYTDANGKTSDYEYEGGNLTKLTLPGEQVVKFVYNAAGQVTEIIRVTEPANDRASTTKLVYYPLGSAPAPCTSDQKATVIEDPDWKATVGDQHETTYCSNVLDEVERTVDAEGHASSDSYNPFGDEAWTTAATPGSSETGDTTTSLVYDETGTNLECVIQGTSEHETSCPASRPDASALVSSFYYRNHHDPYSPSEVKNPENHNVYACNNEGGQEKEGSEEATCPSATTGPAGSPENETDQLPEQNALKFEYNTNGTIKSSTDADGNTTTYEYDEKGNLKKITPPAGSGLEPTTITVDADSRPHVITNGAGHIETITYDNENRITAIEYTGTGTAKTVKFEYEANGNLIKREDSTGTTKYIVDALNRVTKEELPGSVSNSYEYDAASNMLAFTDSGGTIKYTYNGLNELVSMVEPGTGDQTTTFAYNNDHQLDQITYASGVKETYKLQEATGRPETITAEGTTGTSVPKLTYSYKSAVGEDDTSMIQSLTESTSGAVTEYTYDKLNRLTEALTKTADKARYAYKLDGNGNALEQTVNPSGETGGEKTYYGYSGEHELGNELECRQTVATPCTGSSTTELSHYSYDGAGEMTAITPKHETNGATLTYNAASELSAFTPSGGSEETLAYGGTGQDDLVAEGSAKLQNSLLGVTQETSTGGSINDFARTPSGLLIDERLPTGAKYNPLYDAQGDIIALVNNSGKVERTFHYTPDGENTKLETGTPPYLFGYKGGYRSLRNAADEANDRPNGMYHFGARFYEPTAGRWTQRDPLNQATSPTQGDRYLFAGDDPVNLNDPTGRSELSELGEEAENAVEGMYEYPEDTVACSYTGIAAGVCEEYLHPQEAE